MKVVINEHVCEYTSDYPVGWQYSAGDPFKFPVDIEGYSCFIKRFQKKGPEDIPGWDLLQVLTGRFEKGLITVYDIVNVQEKNKDVYYVFFEYVAGNTVEGVIQKGDDVDLEKLTHDLFVSIQSLYKNKYWFVDFCEKNIFLKNSGNHLFIDLDSTHPTEEYPNTGMDGNKYYWINVLKFYEQVLPDIQIKNADKTIRINGISFNYLQVPFMVLHLKLYFEKNIKDYNSNELFESLPAELNKFAPSIQEFFIKAFENGETGFSENDIASIKEIVLQIIKYKTPPPPLPPLVLTDFSASSTSVNSNERFTLTWKISNASELKLYRNNVFVKRLAPDLENIELTEIYDGGARFNSYKLVAQNNRGEMAETEEIAVHLKNIDKEETITVDPDDKDKEETIIIDLNDKGKKVDPVNPRLLKILLFLFLAGVLIFAVFSIFKTKNHKKDGPGSSGVDSVVKSPDTTKHTDTSSKPPVNPNVINFVDDFPKATWISGVIGRDGISVLGANTLASTALGNDPNGHADVENVLMEDGRKYTAILVHPRQRANGTITGVFPLHTLNGRRKFEAMVGFVNKSGSLGYVVFQVWVHYHVDNREAVENVTTWDKVYNNSLHHISANFPANIPADFSIELRVNGGINRNYNWVAWVDPRVTIR